MKGREDDDVACNGASFRKCRFDLQVLFSHLLDSAGNFAESLRQNQHIYVTHVAMFITKYRQEIHVAKNN